MSIRLQLILQFLRETCEMFYWVLWCPSKLQQRINKWSPRSEKEGQRANTTFYDILLYSFDLRFFCQFFLLILLLSLPLFPALKSIQGVILVVSNFLVAYGLAVLFLPGSIVFSLLTSIIYVHNSAQIEAAFELTWQAAITAIGPMLSQFDFGQAAMGGSIWLGIMSSIVEKLLQQQQVERARTVFVLGSIFIAIGVSGFTRNTAIVCLTALGTGFISIILRKNLNSSNNQAISECCAALLISFSVLLCAACSTIATLSIIRYTDSVFAISSIVTFMLSSIVSMNIALAIIYGLSSNTPILSILESNAASRLVAFSLVTILGSIISTVIAVNVAIVVVHTSSLPIISFLVCTWAVSLCFASHQSYWSAAIIAITLVGLCFERLGLTALTVIPVALLSYYHIFPDYLLFATSSLSALQSRFLPWISSPLKVLRRLPPYTSEYLWLSLPNHDRLLVTAFQKDPTETLVIFQGIQSQPLPGFQSTIKKALPQIVADQFSLIRDRASLTQTATSEHPILPFLIPRFYSPESESAPFLNPELETLVPRLHTIANDVSKALEASISALRERGLENILAKLNTLSGQLPGLGLKQSQIQRWQLVLERWHTVIELEIAEQQKLSQGELLNPFQFGNPLRRDRPDLFKGRTKFSEQILRLVLDRNRPTLVLHGARRSGKSSFLLNLPRLLPSDLIPIYLDLQRQGTTNSDADFLYSLAKAIYDDCRAQGIRLPTLPERPTFYQNSYPLLEDWLDDAFKNFSDRRILLNLDEFEKIGEAIAQGRITLRLFDELRSLIQHSNQLAFLFSGVQTLDELGPNWSSYFISIVPIEMSYLEPHEAEQLLTNPDPEFELGYAPGIVEEILTLTHCQPYLLQLIGWTLVNQANLRQVRVVDRSLLQTAIQDSFTQGEPYFTNLWTEFTGTTLSERAAGQAALIEIAYNQPIPNPNDSATQAALTRLHRYHILKNNAFEVPLVEQWVRDRAILTEL